MKTHCGYADTQRQRAHYKPTSQIWKKRIVSASSGMCDNRLLFLSLISCPVRSSRLSVLQTYYWLYKRVTTKRVVTNPDMLCQRNDLGFLKITDPSLVENEVSDESVRFDRADTSILHR